MLAKDLSLDPAIIIFLFLSDSKIFITNSRYDLEINSYLAKVPIRKSVFFMKYLFLKSSKIFLSTFGVNNSKFKLLGILINFLFY